jgi:Zn-dependent protease with chaperone function
MQGLLPLLIVLSVAQATMGQPMSMDAPEMGRLAVMVLGVTVLWMALSAAAVSAVCAAGSRHTLEHLDQVLDLIPIIGFTILCLVFGWGSGWRAYTPILLPWFVWQGWTWWVITPAVNKVVGTIWTRREHLLHQLRFSLLPVALALPLADGVAAVGNYVVLNDNTSIGQWFLARLGPQGNLVASFVVLVIAVSAAPALLSWLWNTHPLPAGPLRESLLRLAIQAGVKLKDVRIWRPAGGRELNAVMLGVLPGTRRVLLSHDLVRQLPPEEIAAVVGHELGHARHQHLFLYIAFLVLVGSMAWMLTTTLIHATLPTLVAWGLGAATGQALLGVVLVLLTWRLAFPWLSRQCERQADLAGAELAGSDNLSQALRRVAALSGAPLDQPNPTHHAMRERLRFLADFQVNPSHGTAHHRQVRRIFFTFFAAALVSLLMVWMTTP